MTAPFSELGTHPEGFEHLQDVTGGSGDQLPRPRPHVQVPVCQSLALDQGGERNGAALAQDSFHLRHRALDFLEHVQQIQ